MSHHWRPWTERPRSKAYCARGAESASIAFNAAGAASTAIGERHRVLCRNACISAGSPPSRTHLSLSPRPLGPRVLGLAAFSAWVKLGLGGRKADPIPEPGRVPSPSVVVPRPHVAQQRGSQGRGWGTTHHPPQSSTPEARTRPMYRFRAFFETLLLPCSLVAPFPRTGPA